MLTMKKRGAVLAALALVLAMPYSVYAQENEVQQPGPFKSKIIEMLRSDPFSMYWDGTTAADADKKTAKKAAPARSGAAVKKSTAVTKADKEYQAEQLAKVINKIRERFREQEALKQQAFEPEIFVEEDTSLDIWEDNSANENAALYEYSRGESYDVYAAPGFISDVQLKPGEQITGITIGDAISWSVETRLAADKTWHVYIKPLQLGVVTNMIINTDSHYYSLRLIADEDYSPVVSWTYPGEAREEYSPQGISMEVESVQDINFDYRISGKYSWTPESVFDDGFKTYLVLPAGKAARHTPVIFQKRGDVLLNMDYRIVNDTIIIDRVCNEIYMITSNTDRVVIRNEHAVTPWHY